MLLKPVLKGLTPPYLWEGLRRLRPRALTRRAEWEYVPEGWARQASDPRIKGWDVDAIVAAYRAKWPSYLAAIEVSGPLGVYHEVIAGAPIRTDHLSAHNTILCYGYVLALAGSGRERVSILDWGGGIGHYYPLSKALLPDAEIDYHCKDVPAMCSYGRELFPEAHFYTDDSCLARRYDVVIASDSLQYSPEWRDTLAGLAGATAQNLYITRLPTALRAASFVLLQRAYAYGYDTEYLGWVVNRDDLLQHAQTAGMHLMREFLLAGSISAAGAPEDPVPHRGYLFRPTDRSDPASAAPHRAAPHH
jgi:putative methyltransferase (TIGR04325 family)